MYPTTIDKYGTAVLYIPVSNTMSNIIDPEITKVTAIGLIIPFFGPVMHLPLQMNWFELLAWLWLWLSLTSVCVYVTLAKDKSLSLLLVIELIELTELFTEFETIPDLIVIVLSCFTNGFSECNSKS